MFDIESEQKPESDSLHVYTCVANKADYDICFNISECDLMVLLSPSLCCLHARLSKECSTGARLLLLLLQGQSGGLFMVRVGGKGCTFTYIISFWTKDTPSI